ncbi:E3 ubiquitin-protein ligase NEURL3 [Rhinoderma darwinii]|uniref:E3 ubiquitin-protein ligase NEURL3 n=1 Tax=Rhinoderma darwinii TaxID=43563 RepID=UPI003F671778
MFLFASLGLSFHPHSKGRNILLNSCLHKAKRCASFHDGLTFSNRPLLPREKVWVKVLEVEQRWHGALRVGFTSVNPNDIDSAFLPPFACPNLSDYPGFWAVGISEELCKEGDEICFWTNKKGQALLKKKGQLKPKVLFAGIPRKTPLWVMLDVYGQTKALQLLDMKTKHLCSPCCCDGNKEPLDFGPSHLGTTVTKHKAMQPPNSKHSMEKSAELDLRTKAVNIQLFREDEPNCVICQDRIADTLLLPCRHCFFCKPCVQKFREQNNICPLCRQCIFITRGVREGHLLIDLSS